MDIKVTDRFSQAVYSPIKARKGYNPVSWRGYPKGYRKFHSETGGIEIIPSVSGNT